MGFFTKLKEQLRDKTRDELCAALCAMGLDACMVERDLPEGVTTQYLSNVSKGSSLGLIEIKGGPIRWVNVARLAGGPESSSEYRNIYLVPDSSVYIEGVKRAKFAKVRSLPWIGRVVGFRWKGQLPGDLISQLNEDSLLNQSLTRLKKEINIYYHNTIDLNGVVGNRYWVIVPESNPPPSKKLWDCCNTIARHLLESSEK